MAPKHLRYSTILAPPEGNVIVYRDFFDQQTSNIYFTRLLTEIEWQQQHIKLYGRDILQPRLTAWHGEPGIRYRYSGITLTAHCWTETLYAIKQALKIVVAAPFNSVLLNLYRNGNDSMSWHSDDEKELGTHPAIASVSLGASRRFQFKHKHDNTLAKINLELADGSLLIMQGDTQHNWKHQLPKVRKPLAPRINLTYRVIGQ